MAARNGKCFHTVERHGKGIAHANHLPTVWGQCPRSEEHTSELQSQSNFVCRLLLEKKNMTSPIPADVIVGGVSIIMVTKDSGNKWRGDAAYNFSTGCLSPTDPVPDCL